MVVRRKKKTTKKKTTKGKKSMRKKTPPKRTPKRKNKRISKGVRAKMKKDLLKRLQEDQDRKDAGGKGIFKGDTGVNFWSPEGGDHLIDFIPFLAGENHPTVQEGKVAYSLRVKVHYGIGSNEDKSALCLYETFGQPCPICEHRLALRTEGADEDIWKALYPKKRAIYNILCFDSSREEDKGVQVWEVAEFYMQKHLDTLMKGRGRRPGGGEGTLVPFTDPDEGKSIAFTINPPKTRNDFAEYIGHRFEERDYEIDDDTLEDAQILDELIHIPTYESVYEEYYGEPIDDGDDEDEDEYDEDEENEDEDYDEEDEDEDEDEEEDEDEDEDDDDEDDEEECPGGGDFGSDTNELDGCEECDVWEECLAEQQKRKKNTKRKKKKTTKKRKRKPSTKGKKKRKLRNR